MSSNRWALLRRPQPNPSDLDENCPMPPSITASINLHSHCSDHSDARSVDETPVSVTHQWIHDAEWGDIEEIVVESEALD